MRRGAWLVCEVVFAASPCSVELGTLGLLCTLSAMLSCFELNPVHDRGTDEA